MSLGGEFLTVLEAARTGAPWAWRAIYRDLSPVVLRYLRARGAPDPEDLTGEVFVQVVSRIGRFTGGEAEFRAWVITIAHHRSVDAVRRLVRRPVEAVPYEALVANGPTGNGEADALDALGTDRVRNILNALAPAQRDVLFLRILVGLTVPEVARVLGKRQGAVKALQARGLAAIRRSISREAVTF